jgi:integrase
LSTEGLQFFEKVTAGRSGEELMFPAPSGKAWGAQDQKRPMAAACAKANISPPVGFHALRHTYGSLLAMESVPLAVIAQAMGHADTRMTERHYAHLRPNYVAETIRANLPQFMTSTGSKVSDLDAARQARSRKKARAGQ